jgi:hypothetical protein
LSDKKKKKSYHGLRLLLINILEATTNQKHVAAIDNGTKKECKWQVARGKCNSIILAIKLGGDKKIK